MINFLRRLWDGNDKKGDDYVPARPWRWPPGYQMNELEEDHMIEEEEKNGGG
jgi:hypothetical protein